METKRKEKSEEVDRHIAKKRDKKGRKKRKDRREKGRERERGGGSRKIYLRGRYL